MAFNNNTSTTGNTGAYGAGEQPITGNTATGYDNNNVGTTGTSVGVDHHTDKGGIAGTSIGNGQHGTHTGTHTGATTGAGVTGGGLTGHGHHDHSAHKQHKEDEKTIKEANKAEKSGERQEKIGHMLHLKGQEAKGAQKVAEADALRQQVGGGAGGVAGAGTGPTGTY